MQDSDDAGRWIVRLTSETSMVQLGEVQSCGDGDGDGDGEVQSSAGATPILKQPGPSRTCISRHAHDDHQLIKGGLMVYYLPGTEAKAPSKHPETKLENTVMNNSLIGLVSQVRP